jgi:hypothetical protein
MATFPSDQFDVLPDDLLRVGAHRGPKPKGRGWIAFAWAALATGVLVALGLFFIALADGDFPFAPETSTSEGTTTPEVSADPTATPVTDPSTVIDRDISVTVLNGTAVEGLQGEAATVLEDDGWTVGSQATSTATDLTATVVYYSDAANEDVARGIAIALGVGTVSLNDTFQGAAVTVVVGTDFVPAAE